MASPNEGVITQTLSTVTQAGTASFPSLYGAITQILGSDTGYSTTAQYIDAGWNVYQQYKRPEMWQSDNGSKFTFASFLRMPAQVYDNQDRCLFQDYNIKIWWRHWDNGGTDLGIFAIYLDDAAGNGDFVVFPLGRATHGIELGDWFAFMFAIDWSGVTPVYEVWVQKVGESTPTDIDDGTLWTPDDGPITFDFDDTQTDCSFGAHTFHGSNYAEFDAAGVYLTNEFVDWSSSAQIQKYISSSGYPVDLGADGSLLTGTQPKHYAADGDLGTNNTGSENNWTEYTEDGPIVEASTSPSDGAPIAGYKTWVSQAGTAEYDPKDVTSICAQTLPFISQFLWDAYYGAIVQTLPFITQASTAEFFPGTSTGVITQPLSLVITQAITADFFAGTTKGPAAQTLWPITQALTGTYAPGISSGVISQTINGISQTMNGTHQRAHFGSIDQTLVPISQVGAATFAPGTSVGVITQDLQTVSQALTGYYEIGGSIGWITLQELPFITQALVGVVYAKGAIEQTLPLITQALTGTYAPDTSTGSLSQTLKTISQELTGSRWRIGTIDVGITFLSQSLTGNFTAGASTGVISNTLKVITQAATGQFAPGTSTGIISQELPFIRQSSKAVTFTLIKTIDRLVWEQRDEELIWEIETDELVWER